MFMRYVLGEGTHLHLAEMAIFPSGAMGATNRLDPPERRRKWGHTWAEAMNAENISQLGEYLFALDSGGRREVSWPHKDRLSQMAALCDQHSRGLAEVGSEAWIPSPSPLPNLPSHTWHPQHCWPPSSLLATSNEASPW